jgi:hydroxyethylthiazole kinase-like uncharacterized protein yjeF
MYIYTSEEIRRVDSIAESNGMSSFTLMENAGREIFRLLFPHIHKQDRVIILSGRGNNGGDGIVLARYLKLAGINTDLVFPVGMPKTAPAIQHFEYFRSLGFDQSPFQPETKYDMIIDGILGVGARLPMKEEVGKILKWISEQSGKKVAIDIPTGVMANEGKCDQNAYQADITFVLHGYKPSCFLFPSADYYGKLYIVDIGLPHESKWKVWTKTDVVKSWPKSKANAHKGIYGNGLLIAGSDSMPGSAALASIGAMRLGIGKLTVATSRHASLLVGAQIPEATFIYDLLQNVNKMEIENTFSCLAVGPGLEPNDSLEQLITKLLPMDIPKILDAGALRARDYSESQNYVIVTPHPGEFSRMTGLETKNIQENRIQIASQYAMQHRVIVVLKGQYTVIAFPDGSGLINLTGNRALSKGGSGDILTGMLLASVGIHSSIHAAVANAVYLHGACADLWVQSNGSATMTAHDFQQLLPFVCKEIENEVEECKR